jgi:hypothetical protein
LPQPLGIIETGKAAVLSPVTVSTEMKFIEKVPVEPGGISSRTFALVKVTREELQAAVQPEGGMTDEQAQSVDGMAMDTDLMSHPPPLYTFQFMVTLAAPLGTTDGAVVTE